MSDRLGKEGKKIEDESKAKIREGQTKGQRNPVPQSFASPPPATYYPHPAYYPPGAYGFPPPQARYYFPPLPPPGHYGYNLLHPSYQTPQSSGEINPSSHPNFRQTNFVTPDPRRTSAAPPGYVASGTDRPSVGRRDLGVHGRREQTTSPSTSPSTDSAVRFDSSLGALTKRFVDMLQAAPSQTLDLNEAVKQLGVQKRRIYDITNVLEGIGLIRKDGKNNVAWCGVYEVDFEQPQDEQIQRIHTMHDQRVHNLQNESQDKKDARKELEQARNQEQKLNTYLKSLNAQVALFTQDRRSTSRAPQPSILPDGVHDPKSQMYITYSDLINHPGYKDDNLIALRAPRGTSIEVPDPDQGGKQGERSYQMYITNQSQTDVPGQPISPGEPIDVHLVRPLVLPESESGSRTNTSSGQEQPMLTAVGHTELARTPSPIHSSAKKKKLRSTTSKQNVHPRSFETAPRPPPFRDLSADRLSPWVQGNPFAPWGVTPAHPTYGFYDFSSGMAARAHHPNPGYAYSPQLFSNKRSRRDETKESPPDTPGRSREAHGLMNSPLGDVLPQTPAGIRNDQQFECTPTYGTQDGCAGSLGGALDRSDSPLYELPSLAVLPPTYSPHPSRMRFSPLDWRLPNDDSSPEKGSTEE